MKGRLLDTGSRVFKFPKGFEWDGDEEIIHWIMDKLGLGDGEWKVEEDTFFTIHSSRREKE